MADKTVEISNEIIAYAIEKRREFHRHPELGFQEYRTSGIVQNELQALGFEVQSGIAQTGVVGVLPGKEGAPVIMLRFDMDALPIEEENEIPYRSENPGIMHACGHDAHVAIGLGLAKWLTSKVGPAVDATLKFVFQPAEEGMGGAERMVAEGVLENPKPDYCLGVHVWNEKPLNWVAVTSGPFMAGALTFTIAVTGKGGHGAIPNETRDPVVASAHIIQGLQSIVSRNVPPMESGVISVCTVHGGNAFNIIPQTVELSGTVRYFKPEIKQILVFRMQTLVNNIATAYGCEVELCFKDITPPVINDPKVVNVVTSRTASKFQDHIFTSTYQSMGSEDYSYFINEVPGCFMFVGAAVGSNENRYGHHHPRFNIDEQVIPNAIALLHEAIQDLTLAHGGM